MQRERFRHPGQPSGSTRLTWANSTCQQRPHSHRKFVSSSAATATRFSDPHAGHPSSGPTPCAGPLCSVRFTMASLPPHPANPRVNPRPAHRKGAKCLERTRTTYQAGGRQMASTRTRVRTPGSGRVLLGCQIRTPRCASVTSPSRDRRCRRPPAQAWRRCGGGRGTADPWHSSPRWLCLPRGTQSWVMLAKLRHDEAEEAPSAKSARADVVIAPLDFRCISERANALPGRRRRPTR
jgi:hypothetical protein